MDSGVKWDEARFAQVTGEFPLMMLVALCLWRTTEADGDLLGNGIWQFRLKWRMEISRTVVLHIRPALNSLEKTTTAFGGMRVWKVGSFYSPEKGIMKASGWKLMLGKFTCETESKFN